MFKEIDRFFKSILIFLLQLWKTLLSPFLGNNCRYSPTCSEYATECLKKYNIFWAVFLIIKRFLKCNALFALSVLSTSGLLTCLGEKTL